MLFTLPSDLVTVILSLLPLENLYELRLVNKDWDKRLRPVLRKVVTARVPWNAHMNWGYNRKEVRQLYILGFRCPVVQIGKWGWLDRKLDLPLYQYLLYTRAALPENLLAKILSVETVVSSDADIRTDLILALFKKATKKTVFNDYARALSELDMNWSSRRSHLKNVVKLLLDNDCKLPAELNSSFLVLCALLLAVINVGGGGWQASHAACFANSFVNDPSPSAVSAAHMEVFDALLKFLTKDEEDELKDLMAKTVLYTQKKLSLKNYAVIMSHFSTLFVAKRLHTALVKKYPELDGQIKPRPSRPLLPFLFGDLS